MSDLMCDSIHCCCEPGAVCPCCEEYTIRKADLLVTDGANTYPITLDASADCDWFFYVPEGSSFCGKTSTYYGDLRVNISCDPMGSWQIQITHETGAFEAGEPTFAACDPLEVTFLMTGGCTLTVTD
jgi:hypothetical protein